MPEIISLHTQTINVDKVGEIIPYDDRIILVCSNDIVITLIDEDAELMHIWLQTQAQHYRNYFTSQGWNVEALEHLQLDPLAYQGDKREEPF